nr:hypothetical protein [Pandoravirus massiliensis]
MPALLEPEAEARLQKGLPASALPYYLVGVEAQLRNLGWIVEWLQSLPVGLAVDPIYIPIFQRLAVPLDALYDPALLASAKALYVPFWEALAIIIAQAPDVRLGLAWPPTPASLYDATTSYLQQRGLIASAPLQQQQRNAGAPDLYRASQLASVGLGQLSRVIENVRAQRALPAFGPEARANPQRRGPCRKTRSSPPAYFMVAAVGRDGRAVALLTHEAILTHMTSIAAHLVTAPDGSYVVDTGPRSYAALYPRAFDRDSVETVLRAAVERVRGGRPWQMGMRRLTLSDLPDKVATLLLREHIPPPYYGIYFDECDAVPLLAAARGDLGRSATEALYPPHSLLQTSAARIAQDAPYSVAALESGVLPDELRETIASYALLRACASDQPPDAESLAPAAALIGISADQPIYKSSPGAFCGDVWTVLDDQVQRRASVQPSGTPIQEPQRGNAVEPPRSRQRPF